MRTGRHIVVGMLMVMLVVLLPAAPASAKGQNTITCDAYPVLRLGPGYAPYGVSAEGNIRCTRAVSHIHINVSLWYCVVGCPENRYRVADALADSYGIDYVYTTAVRSNCLPGKYYARAGGQAESAGGFQYPISHNWDFTRVKSTDCKF